MVGAPQAFLQLVQIDHRWLSLAEQYRIVTLATVLVAPKHAVWENLEKRGDHALGRVLVALIERYPQGHHAARVEMLLAHLVVLNRVERGTAFDPRVDWIGGDDVELLFGGAHKMPAIVIDHLDFLAVHDMWVLLSDPVHNVIILLTEHGSHGCRHEPLD